MVAAAGEAGRSQIVVERLLAASCKRLERASALFTEAVTRERRRRPPGRGQRVSTGTAAARPSRCCADAVDGGRDRDGVAYRGAVLRVVQLRGDLPVPPDRRRAGRPLDLRRVPRGADVGDRRGPGGPVLARRVEGRPRHPVPRRRGGLAVEPRRLRRSGRRPGTARCARRHLHGPVRAETPSSISRGPGRRAFSSGSAASRSTSRTSRAGSGCAFATT